MFFIDQEFKELRLIKDGLDIPFLVEGDENSSDMSDEAFEILEFGSIAYLILSFCWYNCHWFSLNMIKIWVNYLETNLKSPSKWEKAAQII